MAKLPRTTAELEDFVMKKGLHPTGKMEYKGKEVYIAETEHETDKKWEYPLGYYQVSWFCGVDGKFDGGSWVEFDAMHDLDMTREGRQQARINAAIKHAQDWVDAQD